MVCVSLRITDSVIRQGPEELANITFLKHFSRSTEQIVGNGIFIELETDSREKRKAKYLMRPEGYISRA